MLRSNRHFQTWRIIESLCCSRNLRPICCKFGRLITQNIMTQKESVKLKTVPQRKGSLAWLNRGAEFFPVASGVHTPYIGQDDSITITTKNLKTSLPQSRTKTPVSLQANKNTDKHQTIRPLGDIQDPFPDETAKKLENMLPQTYLYLPAIKTKRERQQSKKHLKEISGNLNFTNDVVALHSCHHLAYNREELSKTIYKGKDKDKAKIIGLVGRHDAHGPPLKHVPCHLNTPGSNLLHKPDAFVNIDKSMKHEMEDILYSVAKTTRPYGYSFSNADDKPDSSRSAESKSEWDEYVLSLLSKSTAKWITSELISSGAQHVRLAGFLKERYKEEGKGKEIPESQKQKEVAMTTRHSKAGAELEKVLTEAIFDIHFTPSFTLPSAVGDKKLITDNAFQQEMLAGAFPVRGKKIPRKSIVLNTNSKVTFEKRLQMNYPEDPCKWTDGRRNSKAVKIPVNSKVVKGLQRWDQLPCLLQDDSIPSFKSFDEQSVKTLGKDELLSIHQARENDNVLRISEEWRSKWLLEKRWQNVSTAELTQGMNDIHDHVRLAAVAACSKAAEVRQRKRTEQSFGLPSDDKQSLNVEEIKSELEPELLDCVTKLLEDGCKQVRITAAVTLCNLNIEESKAVEILQETVQNGSAIERWIASQCLASAGHCRDTVISELVSQTSANDLLRQKQSAMLLQKLSHQTSLVHAIVAEQLNSSSCQDRLVACRLLPRLQGTLNKDVAQKLSHMMWNDWQDIVRTAAAQALGRTGNGKLVHDALLKRLSGDNERVQVDAVRKLANLGIMTAHLLPAFLSCFTSEFVFVRIEAAMAAGVINTPDDDIIAALVKLANEDPSWKVKAHAIKALGAIKKITDDVIDMLVWSMRYGKQTAVRAEACNTVAELGLKDSRALSVLQDRLIVETEEVVRSEARKALQTLNAEFTGNVEMMNTIKSEVKRLCNKNNVVSSILASDQKEDFEKGYQRMIAIDNTHRCPQSPPAGRSMRSSISSKPGWDPILAGFRARSAMSEPSTPVVFKMERSLLPMDLNSATSEGSLGSREDLDSEYAGSGRSDVTDGELETIVNEDYSAHE